MNTKIIEFNIDTKFNDALDGLMILDLFEVPIETIESLSKKINDESIIERFNKSAPGLEFINKIPEIAK